MRPLTFVSGLEVVIEHPVHDVAYVGSERMTDTRVDGVFIDLVKRHTRALPVTNQMTSFIQSRDADLLNYVHTKLIN